MTRPSSWMILALLLPGLAPIVFLVGSGVWIAVGQSVGLYDLFGDSAFDLSYWDKIMGRKVYLRSVKYSLYVGVWSALLSVAIAYPLALWLRKPFKGSLFVGALLKAPLLVHGLVAAFLFVNVIAYHGLLNQIMQALGLWEGPQRLQNDKGAVGVLILQVWKNIPFALLLLTGAVQGISDDVLDAARDLGARGWARFRKVIMPLSLPAMQAALVIIFIGALSDYSFQVIAGPTNRQSLVQLMVQYKGRGDWHSAGGMAVTLMVLAFAGAALIAASARLILNGRLR